MSFPNLSMRRAMSLGLPCELPPCWLPNSWTWMLHPSIVSLKNGGFLKFVYSSISIIKLDFYRHVSRATQSYSESAKHYRCSMVDNGSATLIVDTGAFRYRCSLLLPCHFKPLLCLSDIVTLHDTTLGYSSCSSRSYCPCFSTSSTLLKIRVVHVLHQTRELNTAEFCPFGSKEISFKKISSKQFKHISFIISSYYHIISYHIISYHIISYHIISYHHIIILYHKHPKKNEISKFPQAFHHSPVSPPTNQPTVSVCALPTCTSAGAMPRVGTLVVWTPTQYGKIQITKSSRLCLGFIRIINRCDTSQEGDLTKKNMHHNMNQTPNLFQLGLS